jgi:hypothetical protein
MGGGGVGADTRRQSRGQAEGCVMRGLTIAGVTKLLNPKP